MKRVTGGLIVLAFGVAVIGIMILTLVVGVVVRPALPMFAPTPARPVEVGAARVGPDTYTVDARDPARWVAFDFSRRSVVEVASLSGLDWDLAFQRFRIRTNGGATNPSGRGAAVDLGRVPFDSVGFAPEAGWAEDVRVSGSEVRNPALERWYDYSWMSHRLKPNGHVHAIRTADGKYAKVQVLGYYCEGGSPGCVTFRYVYAGDGGRALTAEGRERP